MKLIFLWTTAAAAAIGASPMVAVDAKAPPAVERVQLDQQPYERPAAQWRDIEDADPTARECLDKIRRVRAESGLPQLDRRPFSPEEPLFIKAVDQRIDGCPAIVMARDTSDIRPIPEVEENEVTLIPADGSRGQ